MVGCHDCCEDMSCGCQSSTAGANQPHHSSALEPGAHAQSAARCWARTPGPAIRWRREMLQAAQGVGHATPPLGMPLHFGDIVIALHTPSCPQLQGREVHKACSQGHDPSALLPGSCVSAVSQQPQYGVFQHGRQKGTCHCSHQVWAPR